MKYRLVLIALVLIATPLMGAGYCTSLTSDDAGWPAYCPPSPSSDLRYEIEVCTDAVGSVLTRDWLYQVNPFGFGWVDDDPRSQKETVIYLAGVAYPTIDQGYAFASVGQYCIDALPSWFRDADATTGGAYELHAGGISCNADGGVELAACQSRGNQVCEAIASNNTAYNFGSATTSAHGDAPNGICRTQCNWIGGTSTIKDQQCSANPHCSDGAIQAGEECDDGNIVGGDGCDPNCINEVCGNGVLQIEAGEECDFGTGNGTPPCDVFCEWCGSGPCWD